MAQFDVHRNAVRASQRRIPYLLDIQANYLSELRTRVVVPLLDTAVEPLRPVANLNPQVSIDGRRYLLLFQEIAGVSTHYLGARVTSLESRRNELLRALDVIWTGT